MEFGGAFLKGWKECMRNYYAWDDEHLSNDLKAELDFTRAYQEAAEKRLALRECACLRIALPASAMPVREGDWFVGRRVFRPLGVAPSYWNDETDGLDHVGFYADLDRLTRVMNRPDQTREAREAIAGMIAFWRDENTTARAHARFDECMRREMPSDLWNRDSGVIFGLYRLVVSQLDYDRLVQKGLPGLRAALDARRQDASLTGEQVDFLAALDGVLEILAGLLQRYEAELNHLLLQAPGDRRLEQMRACVHNLQTKAPASLMEAMQLVLLYATFSGFRDFGRMDVYFGDWYVHDLENGVLSQAEASDLLDAFYCMMRENDTRDGRVILGGVGRRNEANADRFALLAMDTAMRRRELKPQISLRMYPGMSPEVRKKGLEMLKTGMTFPLLFNDVASMRAVEQSMRVSHEEAEQYGFFGCGEYVIGHRSMGTPNDIINLAKALEVTLHQGVDPIRGCAHGLNLGAPEAFETFEQLFDAYKKQVEYFAAIAARHHRTVYDAIRETAPMLMLSLLTDDCVARAKPAIDGGLRYLAGTFETYGNITVSDSLVAIRELVYERKRFTLRELVAMLDADFEGYEAERQQMLQCPKFGNGNAVADEMAGRVNDHIFDFVAAQAKPQGLHSYLVVVINNGANSDLGHNTLATADGRRAHTYLSNGNNPMAGMDREGLPAMLRSIASTHGSRTAGMAQNLKLSRELFDHHADAVNDLIDTAFEMGILSLNVSVMNRGDMEDALVHPERHQNLFVRVGGFSARFIDLDAQTQQDVLNRTIY